jgi:hypothetical protein
LSRFRACPCDEGREGRNDRHAVIPPINSTSATIPAGVTSRNGSNFKEKEQIGSFRAADRRRNPQRQPLKGKGVPLFPSISSAQQHARQSWSLY